MYQATTATKKILALRKRIRAVQGGTSASKTISILLYLIHRAQEDTIPTLTSVVSETMPHLKKGARLDFLNIMKVHNYFDENSWNRTDSIYTFPNGSRIEFFSADQPSKVRGPRRERLFINEANNVSYETFEQLEIRTRHFIFLDWNPVSEFWFYTDIKGKREDVEHIILTYKDNEALDPEIVKTIELRKNRKSWWHVYGEGQLGEVEGKIYTDWQIISETPFEAKFVRRGLDFGYTNDPTAIVDIYKYNGSFILDEVCYQKGLSNKQIADILLQKERSILTIADSSEPKSIDEISGYGVLIRGAKKGADSVRQGIQYVQDQKISVTERSLNLLKEYRNYLWEVDKNGKVLNVPEAGFDHCMDAIRYGLDGLKAEDEILRTPVPFIAPLY